MSTVRDDFVSAVINRPCGYARYTVNSGVQDLDDTPNSGKRLSECKGRPNRVLITPEAQAIRWTDDPDVPPTTTVGMPVPAGATLEYTGDLAKFQWIESTAGAVVNVAYYNS